MKKIYVFGNPYLKEDNFAVRVAKNLKNFKVQYCDGPEALLFAEEDELIIIDVVKDAKKPFIIDNVDRLKARNIVSLHDFDLAYFLKLMNKLGDSKKFKIIGLPEKGMVKTIAEEIKRMI